MKKLLIGGCSFSYGQGLELFHPDINGKDWPERPRQWDTLPNHIKKFTYENRWSKLLADKLGLEEINTSKPGNSNLSSSIFLKSWINKNGLDDIDTIIFQLTIPVRSGILPDEKTNILTGYELAIYLEKYLNEIHWKDLDSNQHILSLLDENSNIERNKTCIEDLIKTFDEYTKIGIKCYFLEWISQNQPNEIPYRLNLFGTGETVHDWADRKKLNGGHWMEENNNHQYFWEGHLSLNGNRELTNEIYNSLIIN
jgi:hypothetical protein